MAENDLTGIRPLDSLQTIRGLDAVDRRKERRQKQTPSKEQESSSGKAEHQEPGPAETPDDGDGEHTIDYCA